MAPHPVNFLHTTAPEDSPQLYLIPRIDLNGRLRASVSATDASKNCIESHFIEAAPMATNAGSPVATRQEAVNPRDVRRAPTSDR
jgi:hypothetical protein